MKDMLSGAGGVGVPSQPLTCDVLMNHVYKRITHNGDALKKQSSVTSAVLSFMLKISPT